MKLNNSPSYRRSLLEVLNYINEFNREHAGQIQISFQVLKQIETVNLNRVKSLTCAVWGCEQSRLNSSSKTSKDGVLFARYFIYAFLREHGYTLKQIADATMRNDHSTICAGLKAHENFIRYEKGYKEKFDKFKLDYEIYQNNEIITKIVK